MDVYVSLHTYATLEEVAAVCGQPLAGCAIKRMATNYCEVHVLAPSGDPRDAAIIGHEIAHCFFDRYHAQGDG